MKMKFFVILGFLWVLNSTCYQTTDANIQITGNIEGLGNSKLYIGKIGDYFMNVQIVDSFECKNDSFNYRANFHKQDNLYCINDVNGQFLYFLPDNENIIINGNANNLIFSSISGSENNTLLSDYWKKSSMISDQMMPLFASFNKAQKEHDTVMIEIIKRQQDSLYSVMQILPEKFIEANFDKTASAVILYLYLAQYRTDLPKLKGLYSKLNTETQGTQVSKRIKSFITALESCEVGKSFMDFELADCDNNNIAISSLKGNCFLIEFWTTWCGPCRGELPTLQKAYDKYSSKGFQIISISLDNSKQDWIKALENQKTPWKQTIIKNSDTYKNYFAPFESDVAKAYSILQVPANYLVNSEGLIVATDLRGNALLDKLSEIYKE